MMSRKVSIEAFQADPASIVREMNSFLPDAMNSELAREEMRHLGALLMATPGTTTCDGLAFATVAAVMLGTVMKNEAIADRLDPADVGALMQAGGYLVQTVRALETATGTTFNFPATPTAA